jgi:Family of unknown function (DUF6662)
MLRLARNRALMLLTTVAILSLPTPRAVASESPFGWLYTADVQPPGTFEYEHWSWLQLGQAGGTYHFLQNREELEYGITNRFQVSGYINWSYVNARRNEPDGTTGGPGTDLEPDDDPLGRFTRTRFDSISIEGIYMFLNPLTNPIGLAFYVEPEIGPDEQEIEFRLIAQKNFLDDRLILALNLWTAFENESTKEGMERATMLELDFGASYRFTSNWSVGIEGRNHREFIGRGYGDPEHSAWFIGPVIHYATQRWWATLAYRHQLPVVEAFTQEQRDVVKNGRIYGDEHSRDEVMLKIGIPF